MHMKKTEFFFRWSIIFALILVSFWSFATPTKSIAHQEPISLKIISKRIIFAPNAPDAIPEITSNDVMVTEGI